MTAKEVPYQHAAESEAVGDHLQKLRQEKALPLEEVMHATKISLSNLRAIESMSYENLPADIFVKGQITLYGNFLGLDGRRIAAQFFLQREADTEAGPFLKKKLADHSLAPKQLAEPAHLSSATIAGLLLLFIILSFAGFSLYTSWNPFAFLVEQTKKLSSSALDTFHPANPATGNLPLREAFNLKAYFLQDSQIIISQDDQESIKKTIAKGTNAHWKAEKQIQLEFSQPDCAELQLNDMPLPFPRGERGHYILRLPAISSNL